MERLRKNILLVCGLVLTLVVVSCGDDGDNKKKKAEYPSTSYNCETLGKDTSVALKLIDSSDPRFQGDQVTEAVIKTPEMTIELDLLLAMRFRDNRNVYQIRQGIQLIDEKGPKKFSNMYVTDDAVVSPHVMNLDLGRGQVELEIVSKTLKRAIKLGFGFDRADIGSPEERELWQQAGRQPLFIECEQRK